jgi:hypothetical protein
MSGIQDGCLSESTAAFGHQPTYDPGLNFAAEGQQSSYSGHLTNSVG